MICELCGKDTDRTKIAYIEGTQLRVCGECSKFGETASGSGPAKKGTAPSKTLVTERLQARERRMRTKDVYQEETTTDLIPEYAKVIREARMAKDWKHEELAAKINERESVIAKLENGTMRPSDALIKKLEKALNIKLTEKVTLVKPEAHAGGGKGITLGDLIKVKK